MKEPRRVLVAAQPRASQVLQTMLAGVADLVPASTIAEALKILARNRIDLIICTIAFDESRMVEFLQAVKGTASTADIPFVCCRALPSVLPDSLVQNMRGACLQAGADALLDIAKLDQDKAQSVLKSAVTACLSRR
jgi:CheY-like chemotaxis protein